jgi:hypothetical protein
MKRYTTLAVVALFALLLAACGGAAAPAAPAAAPVAAAATAPASSAGDSAGDSAGAPAPTTAAAAISAATAASRLDLAYANALPQRNQLLLGTVGLADAGAPVTAAQAQKLLPLWQGIRATLNSGAASDAETNALLTQIEAVLTDAQITAIRDMKLTQTQLQDWAKSQGITTGAGDGSGQGTGKSLSPEARATRQAEREASGASSLSQTLLDAVIKQMGSTK